MNWKYSLAALVVLGACTEKVDVLKDIPVLSGMKFIEKTVVDGAPQETFEVPAKDGMQSIMSVDSALSLKWNRISLDTVSLSNCLATSSGQTLCGGSLSWLILNTDIQISMTVVGTSTAENLTLIFHQFSTKP